jgi:myosin heavy subunit
MLGLKVEDVKEAILTKSFIIGGKTIKKPQNLVQAADKRDTLAKMIYSSLFVWLVHKVNQTIACETAGVSSKNYAPTELFSSPVGRHRDVQTGFIGLLDIYGFEQFETNGFEQLLINYANEKLQRHFNRHLFEVEQALYAAEGVDWTYITFNDNKPCLELIEGGSGTVGILSTLDDAWSGMGSSSEKDVKFVSQLHQLFGDFQETSTTSSVKKVRKSGSHPNFKTPKFGNDRQFIILHYAGEVSRKRLFIGIFP